MRRMRLDEGAHWASIENLCTAIREGFAAKNERPTFLLRGEGDDRRRLFRWNPKRQRLEATEIWAWNGVTVFVLEKPIAGREGEGRPIRAGDLYVGIISFAVPSDGRRITVGGPLIVN
jgi:hypothetical protein